MMIPPVIRLGPPPLIPNRAYLILHNPTGWQFAQANVSHPAHFYNEEVLYPGSNGLVNIHIYKPEDILCWMPQDGS